MRTNFSMQNENISIVRGDSLSFNIVMYGNIQSLDSVLFTVKKDWNNTSFNFQKTLEDGVVESEEGIYTVRIAPEDTKDMRVGQYYYDLQISKDDDVMTICRGVFEILYDVSEEEEQE